MPDWITHILVAWTLCTILGFRYNQFTPANTAICMVGALIPDTFKIVIPLGVMGIHAENFLMPLHLPIGSFIIASIFTLFFKERKIVFSFLVLGFLTHYALDLLLTNLNGGIYLLFPFSWKFWQFDVIPDDDFHITILAIGLALVVYSVSLWRKKANLKQKM
jgi:hypothetical protein